MMTEKLLVEAEEGVGVVEGAGLLRDAEAFNRYVERRR
jgi:hypothetical protein